MHPLSISPPGLPLSASSDQATLRHPEATIYRCFLPDLTGFIVFCRAGPSLQHRLAKAVPKSSRPRAGVQPRYSGLRIQGTASSPPSTTSLRYYPTEAFLVKPTLDPCLS